MTDTMPRDIRGLAKLVIAEKRRRGRREAIGKATAVAVAMLVVNAADGWLFMLLIALVHDHWLPAVPTIGYVPAVLVLLAGKVLLPGLFTARRTGAAKVTTPDP